MSFAASENRAAPSGTTPGTPAVHIFFTGGTIAMRASAGGVRPALHGADLLEALEQAAGPPRASSLSSPPISPEARPPLLHPVDWADLPSPHMTPEQMFRLAGDLRAALSRPDCAGVVVTHGTDVMEETAFMLDLLLPTDKPVLITGSMRSFDEAGYDGLRNLSAAVRAAALPLPPGLGVVLLMTDKLFAAREVTKVHSMGIDAFDAPGAGPLGSCVAGGVQVYRRPLPLAPLRPPRIETRVDLVALAPGMDGRILAFCRESGARGLVVEGFGAGNAPPAALEEIERCLEADLPVVLASRCIEGGVWPVYGYRGGAGDLCARGVIPAGNLRAGQARILLMLALGMDGATPETVRRLFASRQGSALLAS